ncbi:MAG: HNH endonuclease family protein [Dictyoglomaceae bacterium]
MLGNYKDDFIKGILDVIFNKLIIIKIEVEDDINAHIIFETLNDRGLELCVSDLLKNYVFSKSEDYLDEVADLWKGMVNNIGDNNIDKFLRHYFSSKFKLVRKEELYKEFKEHLKGKRSLEIKKLMEELDKESEVYSNLKNPTHEFWGDEEIEDMLDELNILGVEQVYILLLSAYDSLFGKNVEEFKKLLRLLINLTFRYSTICRSNPNELEKKYSRIAISLRKKEISYEIICKEFREISPNSQIFIERFKNLEIKNIKLAKYILCKINEYLLKEAGEKELTININKINLEHIIPKKPDLNWKKFLEEKNLNLDELIYRLGNMTILGSEYNKRIKNKFFTEKKSMYQKSNLPLNKELLRYNEFTKEEIEKRQFDMAKIADKIWKV